MIWASVFILSGCLCLGATQFKSEPVYSVLTFAGLVGFALCLFASVAGS